MDIRNKLSVGAALVATMLGIASLDAQRSGTTTAPATIRIGVLQLVTTMRADQ